ncbi:hypothetical protein OX284_012865 [Flavobacterium sp. SUN046]|uniref:hypothetical protein n=1 Tax=Flavobacterium sp. SUN046 TaxID=3002440 RepID=UPI002DC03E2A|nr:hypothetical protein [Flavobacterium sp. SUN046]MEC4050327.1 hypothetical protein [Flavobacterium sp. SUN046]
MTAVVGILNKHAVAIAADSAVTIGGNGGKKIFNKANKVFTLSKQHPVGIMIYNSASFMSTPWETIIKVYRKHLDSTSFPTLKEYEQNFIDFLKERDYYTDTAMQIGFLENFTLDIINSIINDIASYNKGIIENPSANSRLQFLAILEEKIDNLISNWNGISEICPDFTDYTFEMFVAYSEQLFEKINQFRFTENGIIISVELLIKMKRLVYSILRAKEELTNFTGLIFTGFGEDEIYPQLIPINISIVVDNRLRFYINEDRTASISNINNAAICPFAQTDVIDTILTGIDPTLDTIYLSNFDALFKKYNQAIIDRIGDTNPLLTEQIQNLDISDIVNEFSYQNQQIKREYHIIPLMNAVSNLAKEDLSEMAESLIYLTYLKRRITFAEESVGGPVDVAIISKGDGFVWIKRKHYFRPELNQHFFDNYFKT